jgi:hypothetical protein
MDIEQGVLEIEMNSERVGSALRGPVRWLLSKPVLRTAETGAGVVNWLLAVIGEDAPARNRAGVRHQFQHGYDQLASLTQNHGWTCSCLEKRVSV